MKGTNYLKLEYAGKGIGKIAPGYVEVHRGRSDIRVLKGIITGGNYPSTQLFENMDYLQCAHFINIGKLSGRLLNVAILQKRTVRVEITGYMCFSDGMQQ